MYSFMRKKSIINIIIGLPCKNKSKSVINSNRKWIEYLPYSTVAKIEEGAEEIPIKVSSGNGTNKIYDVKIQKLVDDISKLNLIEVGDLNELLKKKLNIPENQMSFGNIPNLSQMMNQSAQEEDAAPVKIQSQFTVKLTKYDETKKVPLIKEIKNLIEGMNLVQAKKFVESAPTTVKADISKEEAEKLAEALKAAGGTIEIV